MKKFKEVEQKPNFSKIEQDILKFWKKNKIFEKSIKQRSKDKQKNFYDGPITANGQPHHGHMLTFAMKDLIPRYWAMKGYRVTRSLGWDCQGIPVEYEVEKKLGFKEKKDIEKYGIAKFNKHCRASVEKYKKEIIELEELMGRLTNKEEEYVTMDKDYIESIWWSLSELYKKGLLYEGFKVVPYSTRAGTTLSNAEVALGGYKKVVDPAITVEFPLKHNPNIRLLAWTTTPWTIPSNLALAVGKNYKYVQVALKDRKEKFILAKDLLEEALKGFDYEIEKEIKVEELIGKEYLPPFDYFKGRKNCHKIYQGFHVTTDSGTGIVHLAPYGVEDNEIFQNIGIESFDVLDEQGDFTNKISDYKGLNYKKANLKIIKDLRQKQRLFKHVDYEHDMPMCWRTNTPLIYKPIKSWYIRVSKLKDRLVELNEKTNWIPAHVKQGRFGNWLAEIKDWAISRNRYWGTSLPIWKSKTDKLKIISSYKELENLSGERINDPHRPYIDEIEFDFEGEHYKRIPDVLDVWYDSGAMPFARFHYPFENKEKFNNKFPAQFIAESVDQTRGWFYSLHALATSLFDSVAFENVVMSGFVLDDNGVKLSKSKKNYKAPKPLIQEFGADAIRLNFFAVPISAGEDSTVSPKTLKLQIQETLLPLWNVYTYLATYANIHNWEPQEDILGSQLKDELRNSFDLWMISKLNKSIQQITQNLDKFYIPKATSVLKSLLSDISKWYIRNNRKRFVQGDKQVLSVLYYTFFQTIKLFAPFTPFVSEYLYRRLAKDINLGLAESVHLLDYPEVNPKEIDEKLLSQMTQVQKICSWGLNLRRDNNLRVRQPLQKAYINLDLKDKDLIEIIKQELNVQEVKHSKEPRKGKTLVTRQEKNIFITLETKLNSKLKEQGLLNELLRIFQKSRKKQGCKMGESITKLIYYTTSHELRKIIKKHLQTIKQTIKTDSVVFKEKLSEKDYKFDDYDLFVMIER